MPLWPSVWKVRVLLYLVISFVIVGECCGDDTTCCDTLFQRLLVLLGSGRKWVQKFFFFFFSPHPPQLFSSSGFSVEHLALRKSRGWGSGTFDEWILLWLTPLLSGCLISILCFFPHLSFTLFLWMSSWPLLLAQDRGCRFNWIVLNSGSALHLLWSSRSLVDSWSPRLPVKISFVTLYEPCYLLQ